VWVDSADERIDKTKDYE
jgi:hypothetical protein